MCLCISYLFIKCVHTHESDVGSEAGEAALAVSPGAETLRLGKHLVDGIDGGLVRCSVNLQGEGNIAYFLSRWSYGPLVIHIISSTCTVSTGNNY